LTLQDEDGNDVVGFCLWCGSEFYTEQEVEGHEADDMKACRVFQELKAQKCIPPVLSEMFRRSGLVDEKEQREE
jgi:hypothetical protein